MQNTKVYSVEMSPHGLKLHEARNPPADEDSMVTDHGFSPESRVWELSSKKYGAPEDAPSGLTLRRFLRDIGGPKLDHPMVDTTGLEGYYDIDLKVQLDVAPGGVQTTEHDRTGGRSGRRQPQSVAAIRCYGKTNGTQGGAEDDSDQDAIHRPFGTNPHRELKGDDLVSKHP